MLTKEVDLTRKDLREMFRKWGIDKSEYDIEWEPNNTRGQRMPGAIVHYLRQGKWQTVSCYATKSRAVNLRQILLFLDRIRISERVGIQYQGLSSSKELVTQQPGQAEKERKESLLDAYDIVGASPDDPFEMIEAVYKKKALYYHPDKGGNPERFKRLTEAYELIKGQHPCNTFTDGTSNLTGMAYYVRNARVERLASSRTPIRWIRKQKGASRN
jgi:hypothetical protein